MKHLRLLTESDSQFCVEINVYRWNPHSQSPSHKLTRSPIRAEIHCIDFDTMMFEEMIADGSPTIVLCPIFKPLSYSREFSQFSHLFMENKTFHCFEVQLGILEERVNMSDTRVIGIDKRATIYSPDGSYIGLFANQESAITFKNYLSGVLDNKIYSSTKSFDEVDSSRELSLTEVMRDRLMELIPTCEMSHVSTIIDRFKSIRLSDLYQ